MIKFLSLVFIVIFELGCATTVPKPFKVNKSELLNSNKKFAMIPIVIPDIIDNQALVKIKFENLIEDKMRNAGYFIVPYKESNEIWKRCMDQVGGIIDTKTGKSDISKFNIVLKNTQNELIIKYQPDAFLHSGIQFVMAKFHGITAYWHGTTELRVSSVLGGFLKEFGTGSWGTINALSLGVNIRDIHGTELYNNWGGIQLTQKVTAGKFIDIPKNELLANQELYDKSVSIVLEPLINPKWTDDNSIRQE